MTSPGPENQTGLTRVLGAGDAAAIMIASMVGVGILTRPGQVGAAFGDLTLALLAWIAGGLVALCGALVHAELGSRYPLAGGDYVYLRRAYGDFPAFLSGWTSFVIGFPGAIALSSIAASQAIIDVLGITPATHATRLIPALAILGGFSLLHAAGLKWGKRIQNLQVILVLAALVVLVTAAWFTAGPSPAAPVRSGPGPVSLTALAGAGLSIFFAYSGWNASAYVAGEIREPTKNLPRALIGGVVLVTALYAAVNLAYFQVVPLQEMGRTINIGGEVARKIFGGAGGRVMSLVELVVFLSCASAMIITGPLICFAMANDGLFPRGLAGVGQRSGVPVRALWLQSLVAAGLMVTGTFDDILDCTIFAILPFAALTTSAAFVLRARDGGQRPPFLAPGGWLTPLVFIAVVLVVEVAVVVTAVLDAKSRWNPIFGALLVGTGVPVYWGWRRRAGR